MRKEIGGNFLVGSEFLSLEVGFLISFLFKNEVECI